MKKSRKGDVTLVVEQNNDNRSLLIQEVREEATPISAVMEYTSEELAAKDLREILPPRIVENIKDYLEFEDAGNDLARVLSRTRDFGVVAKSGEIRPLSLRIQHDVCLNKHSRFMLVVHDPDLVGDGVTAVLQTVFERQQLDPVTQLPNRASFRDALETVVSFVERGTTQVVFAVISLDNYFDIQNDEGREAVQALQQQVVVRSLRMFRDIDVLGALGNGYIGVLLLETEAEAALVPLERLRKDFIQQPLQVASGDVSISIAYHDIKPGQSLEMIIGSCEYLLDKNRQLKNQLIHV